MSGAFNVLEYRVGIFVRDHFAETIPLMMPLGVNDEVERSISQSIVENMNMRDTWSSIWIHCFEKLRDEHNR